MIESIINYSKVALLHSTTVTFIYAIIFTIGLAYLHEVGHVVSARFFGLKSPRIGFARMRQHSKKIPFFHTYFDDDEIVTLTTTQFRMVAMAGIFVDLVVGFAAIALLLKGDGLFRVDYWFGLIMAGGLRLAFTPFNLIPIKRVKNDGYNLFFPDHRFVNKKAS